MPDIAVTLSRCTRAQRDDIADLAGILLDDGQAGQIASLEMLDGGDASVRFRCGDTYTVTPDGKDRHTGGVMRVAAGDGTHKRVRYREHDGGYSGCVICLERVAPHAFVVDVPHRLARRVAHAECVAALTWPRVLAVARAVAKERKA